jgi:glycosyltransferase involved in cell wall biosynthesis
VRILLIHDYASPIGGAEILTQALREGLRRRGHDVRLLASSADSGGRGSRTDYQCLGTTGRLRTLLQTANPWAMCELRRALAEFRPDVVHVRMFLTQLSPLILPLLRDIPSLYHVVWYRPICPLGTKMLPDGTPCRARAGTACRGNGCLPCRDWLPLMLQMRLWRQWRDVFDRIVANSEHTRSRLIADGVEPVEVIPNGVPEQPPRPRLSGPPTVAFAGRLSREKGADVLLRAFVGIVRRTPEARLLLAGTGPEQGALRARVSELGLDGHVTLLGHLAQPEIQSRFAGAWVQAVPSFWEEPFGLVAAEAMMRGTAVVASHAGGLSEIVRHGRTGFLVPPGDTEALSAALLALLHDRKLSEQMGRAGREVALAEYSQSRFVERFVRLYQTLVGREVTPRAVDRRPRRTRNHHAFPTD